MSNFDYKDKSAPKLNDDFKKKFTNNIKGKDAIKLEGLTAVAHEKGMWKFETDIIQFPSDQNGWTAICKTTIGGYDWDPIEEKIVRVEYSDIGDANTTNCSKMVAASYIRMASTRSQARALRKYTNIDMVCSSELSDVVDEAPEPIISVEQLTEIRNLLGAKGIGKEKFGEILFGLFQHTNYTGLTQSQGRELITTIQNFVAPQS
jgi:hypothetical protein